MDNHRVGSERDHRAPTVGLLTEEEVPMAETHLLRIAETAHALLLRLDRITTDQFALGGERTEREALRQALIDAGYIPIAAAKLPNGDEHSAP